MCQNEFQVKRCNGENFDNIGIREIPKAGSCEPVECSGVPRLHDARGKKQVWRPMFETEVIRKQMYCIEEGTCDIVRTFRRPHSPLVTPLVESHQWS